MQMIEFRQKHYKHKNVIEVETVSSDNIMNFNNSLI